MIAKPRTLILCLCIMAVVAAGTTISVTAHADESARKGQHPRLKHLRILALVDTYQGDIGQSVKVDFDRLRSWRKQLFQNDQFPKLKGKTTLHYYGATGKKITRADIDYYFKHYPIKSNEAFMLYYSGHGGHDSKRFTEGQYLAMSGGDIGVADIFFKANASLSIMLIDACSSYPTFPGTGSAGQKTYSASDVYKIQRAVQTLFFDGRGVVSLRAASPGEYAWSNSDSGGHFTNVLFDTVMSADGLLDQYKKTGEVPYWTTVARKTRAIVTADFQRTKEQLLDAYSDQSLYSELTQSEKESLQQRLSAHNQTVYYYNNCYYDNKDRIYRLFYTPWRYNSEAGGYRRRIAIHYGLSNVKNQKVTIAGFYHYDDKQPVMYGSGQNYKALSSQNSYVANYDVVYGTLGIIDDKTNRNGFPKNKYKMIFQIFADGQLRAETSYKKFGKW